MSPEYKSPMANQTIVLREEFDKWGVLFDPDTGETFAVDPASIFIWKHLDGRHTIPDILKLLRKSFENMPEDAEDQVRSFVGELVEKGLAGYIEP